MLDTALRGLDRAVAQVRFENSPLFKIEESCNEVIRAKDVIRQRQPQLGGQLRLNESQSYPEFLALGVLEVSENTLEGLEESFEKFFIPKVYPFPPPALYGNSDNTPRFLREGLLRLVSTIPLTHLQVVLVDALSLGGVFALARRFLKKDHDFIYRQKILTETAEIKEALKDLYEYLKTNLQEKLGGYKDFMDYNRHNADRLEVRALFLSGVDALDNESRGYLQHLVRFGSANGVLCFIYNHSEKEERSKDELFMEKILERFGQRFEAPPKDFNHLNLRVLHDSSTSQEHLNAFAKEVASYYEGRKQVKREVSALQEEGEFWSKNSTHIVRVPIGWDKDCREVFFEIGGDQTQHHTLVCGRSGSGKSNFLNVLIQNLAYYYSPDELRLFLLDYKEGVEFNTYANPPLEHAMLVSVQSSVSYGITFLEWLNGEMTRRSEIFKANRVKDLKEYRSKIQEKMARFIAIIDEFQVLFTDASSKEADKVEQLLTALLKKGRSYGIHLVFSTQTLRGDKIPDPLKAQIGNRVALAMDTDDVERILTISYDMRRSLPKGSPEAIYNNNGGFLDSHIHMIVPYAANEKLQDFILKTNKEAQEQNMQEVPHKLYNGEEPIYMPEILNLQGTSLQLGVGVDYEGKDFILPLANNRGAHLLFVGADLSAQLNWLKILGINAQALGKKLYHYSASKPLSAYLKTLKDYGIAPTHTNAQMFAENLEPSSFILIDSLDDATDLHSEREGQLKQFKAFLELALDNEQHLIIFINNMRKLSSSARDVDVVLNECQYRIVFKSNANDLSKATSTEIRNALHPLNARFYNTATDEYRDFRPYSFKDLNKQVVKDF
ncbi:Cell division protein FtsK [Helicobacter heilmannii]|uniref:helicase HerA-like domain-containing protein n=1 Tax=Helicobacter heilmannii TaxID=35817 RepID=UPI0006A0FB75|nr:helicase HerA-like domain-containing protein [Helicobacter heilmannii]CRF48709.1 Cell division protein FtsK [Helicobacter heilmannii]